jgi:hypothetical protein
MKTEQVVEVFSMKNLARKGAVSVAIAMAVSLGGCGGGMDGDGLSELGTDSEALQRNSDPPDPNDAFLSSGRLTPNTAANDITHTLNPAICADVTATFLAFSRDTSQRIRTLAMNSGVRTDTWGSYGTKTFATGPACAMRNPSGTTRRFVLAGKGTGDNRIYWSGGSWNPAFGGNGLPQLPTANDVWTAIDTNAYTVAGTPALGSGPTSMILAAVGNSNRLHVYWHAIPWAGNWTTRFTSPALPSGVTLAGRPAIAHFDFFVPPAGYYGIAVRATQGGVNKIFVTYFMGDGTGFTGFIPGSTPDWTEWPMPAGTTISSSDPAMTSSHALGDAVTLFFRSGTQIKQTSWFLQEGPVGVMAPWAGTSYASGPSVNVGVMYEGGGTQVVLARTSSNQLHTTFTIPDDQLIP